jgi:hypothetical protein
MFNAYDGALTFSCLFRILGVEEHRMWNITGRVGKYLAFQKGAPSKGVLGLFDEKRDAYYLVQKRGISIWRALSSYNSHNENAIDLRMAIEPTETTYPV